MIKETLRTQGLCKQKYSLIRIINQDRTLNFKILEHSIKEPCKFEETDKVNSFKCV